MARKGLSSEAVIEAAIELINEKGYHGYSMRELAARLHIKPSSLYNHIEGMEQLNVAVGLSGIRHLEQLLWEAARDKEPGEGIMAMAESYRDFARSSPELYQALIEMRTSDSEELKKEILKTVAPFRSVIGAVLKDSGKVTHYQRFLRSILHGFVSLEKEGYLVKGPIHSDESFHYIIEQFIILLEKEKREEENAAE